MRGSCCRRSSSREQSPRLHTPYSLQGPPTLQSQQQQRRRLSSRPAAQREQIKGDAVRACVRGSSGGAWGSRKRRIWAAERGAPFWVALVGAGICRRPQARSAGRQAGRRHLHLSLCGELHLCATPHEQRVVVMAVGWQARAKHGTVTGGTDSEKRSPS